MNIVEKLIEKIEDEDLVKDYLETVIRALVARINSTPFP